MYLIHIATTIIYIYYIHLSTFPLIHITIKIKRKNESST